MLAPSCRPFGACLRPVVVAWAGARVRLSRGQFLGRHVSWRHASWRDAAWRRVSWGFLRFLGASWGFLGPSGTSWGLWEFAGAYSWGLLGSWGFVGLLGVSWSFFGLAVSCWVLGTPEASLSFLGFPASSRKSFLGFIATSWGFLVVVVGARVQ